MPDSISARVDRATHIPDESRTPTPPCPRSAKIELTARCNYRCGFCALSARTQMATSDMDFSLFRKITTEMIESGVQEIGVFFIGESFLAPGLLTSAIVWLKRHLRVPYVFLTSNASLATPACVESVMAAGLDSLKWSVNAADDAQFQAVMGVKSSLLTQAQSHIREAWAIRERHRFPTRLYASSIRYDDVQHAHMQAALAIHVLPYVDEHYWLPLYSMGSLAQAREAELGYRPVAGNIGRHDNPVDPLPCWSAFTAAHVRADGTLTACCFDATGAWVMGDLKTEQFMAAWHSPAFRRLRAQHLAKDVTETACAVCAMYAK